MRLAIAKLNVVTVNTDSG